MDKPQASLVGAGTAGQVALDEHLRVCEMRFASVHSGSQQSGELREPAKVAILKISERSPSGLAARVAALLDDEFLVDEQFGKPTVVIMVAGGAQAFRMLPRVDRIFREGLAKAARATNAWVFTVGTAAGASKYVGEALADYPDIPCIGIAPFGAALDHEQIERKARRLAEARGAKEQTVEYTPTEADNAPHGAALEPHHTHFILIDNGSSGEKAWGTEIEFWLKMQLAYCKREPRRGTARSPIAQLVGSPRTSVRTVLPQHAPSRSSGPP